MTADDQVSPGRYLVGALWGIFAVSIWAGWMVFTRLGVKTELSPYDITALRFGVAGLILSPVLVRQGLALDRLRWRWLIVLVAGAGAPYALVAATGLLFAPAAHAGALIPGAMPLFVALLSAIALRERIARLRQVGLLLIGAGVVAIAGVDLLASASRASLGHLLFLTAAFMWACFTVVLKRSGVTPVHATAIVATISMVFYVPVYGLALNPTLLSAPASDVLFQAVYQGVLTSVVSLVAYNRAVAVLGASRGAAFAALVPVMSMIIGIPVLREYPSFSDLVGIALVSSGVVLATGARLRRTKKREAAFRP